MFSNFSTLDTFNKIAVVAFASAIVFAVVAFIAIWVSKKYKPDYQNAIKRGAVLLGIGYALAFCVVMIFLSFDEMIGGEEIFPLVFYPILTGVILVAVLAVCYLFIRILKPDGIKIFKYVALGLTLGEIVAVLACLGVYYNSVADYYDGVSEVGLYIGAVALILVIACIALFLGKPQKVKSDTKALAYGAVCVALAFALSYVKIFRMPQGGSVTAASMLPIILYSYMFGSRKGVVIGFVYGLLQAVQDPWIIHPAQFLLDYPVAFCAIGVAGAVRESGLLAKYPVVQFVLGGILAGSLRYVCHALSGALAFASYAPEGFNPLAWGFLYNTVTLVDLAISLAAGGVLMISKSFRKLISKQI